MTIIFAIFIVVVVIVVVVIVVLTERIHLRGRCPRSILQK